MNYLFLIIIFFIAIVILSELNYSYDKDGGLVITGPPHISEYNDEADRVLPECQGFEEKYPTKEYYTKKELDEISTASDKCFDAKILYIKEKKRSEKYWWK